MLEFGWFMLKKLINCADRTAIILSTLCVVHCIALPIILIAIPTVNGLAFFSDETFHLWLLYGVIPISVGAIGLGYLHHRSTQVLAFAALGLTILMLVSIVGHDILSHGGEVVASVIGSVLIAFAHLKNLHHRQLLNSAVEESVKT